MADARELAGMAAAARLRTMRFCEDVPVHGVQGWNDRCGLRRSLIREGQR